MQAWLSSCKIVVSCGKPSSVMNCRHQIASLVASVAAMYSDSAADNAVTGWHLEFQDIIELFKVKQYPVVDLDLLLLV